MRQHEGERRLNTLRKHLSGSSSLYAGSETKFILFSKSFLKCLSRDVIRKLAYEYGKITVMSEVSFTPVSRTANGGSSLFIMVEDASHIIVNVDVFVHHLLLCSSFNNSNADISFETPYDDIVSQVAALVAKQKGGYQ